MAFLAAGMGFARGAEAPQGVFGGASREAAYADQIYLGGSLDLDRWVGAPGAKIIFSMTDRNGQSLSVKARLDTLLEVQEIYGEGNYTRLNQLYWEQRLLDDKVLVKFGRLTREVVEIGWLAPTAGPNGGYRLGAWYDNVGGDDLYLNTAGQPLATSGGTPLQRHQQSGFYAMAQQRIWAPAADIPAPPETVSSAPAPRPRSRPAEPRGVSVFCNFMQADDRITAKEEIAEVGVFWTGPFAARPRDDLGVAIGRVHVNNLVAQGEALYNAGVALPSGLPPQPIQHAEYPIEVYYGIKVTPAIDLHPNIQIIHAPGGVNASTDVLLFGLHLGVQF